MKWKFFFFIMGCIMCPATHAAPYRTPGSSFPLDSIPADPKDVGSPQAIVAAFYDVISGKAGEKRNWDRMRTLLLPDSRIIAIGLKKRNDGTFNKRVMSIEDYIRINEPFFDKEGFVEREISSKNENFGNLYHILSTFEAIITKADGKSYSRGLASIQLFNDGKRWWIINILWQNETEEFPLPEKYTDGIMDLPGPTSPLQTKTQLIPE